MCLVTELSGVQLEALCWRGNAEWWAEFWVKTGTHRTGRERKDRNMGRNKKADRVRQRALYIAISILHFGWYLMSYKLILHSWFNKFQVSDLLIRLIWTHLAKTARLSCLESPIDLLSLEPLITVWERYGNLDGIWCNYQPWKSKSVKECLCLGS